MAWIDEVEAATAALERCSSLEEAAPVIARRAALCLAVPPELSGTETARLAQVRDRGESTLERFRLESAALREQLSECHRSGQMVRALAQFGAPEPQECDVRA